MAVINNQQARFLKIYQSALVNWLKHIIDLSPLTPVPWLTNQSRGKRGRVSLEMDNFFSQWTEIFPSSENKVTRTNHMICHRDRHNCTCWWHVCLKADFRWTQPT